MKLGSKIAASTATAALAIGGVTLMAAPAQADLVTLCSGHGGEITLPTDLKVPSGASCFLDGTVVQGDVTVEQDANLHIIGGAIEGEVSVDSDAYFDASDTTVDGDVVNSGSYGTYLEDGTSVSALRAQAAEGAANDGFVYVVDASAASVDATTGELYLNGAYSNAWSPSTFEPLIEAAQEAGQYVVLDFQPGRNHFLDQIRMYEDLLAYPHVGIALDPEWRLTEDQVHLEQIGHVQAQEVNEVTEYLAGFVREHDLPQKMLIVHQFQRQMVRDRDQLDTSRPEVAVVIHADGQGPVASKFDTWDRLQRDAPEGVAWGWKNFIDEDDPMMSPEETYDVEPRPEFVSYQ